jgi:hypothetical protein
MASLHRNRRSPHFSIRFRYQGRNVNRSLGTGDRRKANGLCARIEETLQLLARGRITIPTGTYPIEFICTDGKATAPSPQSKPLGLMKFYAAYQAKLPVGRKEASTLDGEQIHLKHIKRHLGPNRTVQSITKSDLQTYVSKRLKDKYRGKPIQPDTIRKELVTFRMLWNWGIQEGLLIGASPTKHVVLPLTDEKPPFMTRQEIETVIARGGLTVTQEARLWDSIYLETVEINDILEHVRQHARYPFIYPMLVFVAHTSARRSGMIRSLIEDIDFRSRTVLLREKKKSRTKAMTYRRVDMSASDQRGNNERQIFLSGTNGRNPFSRVRRSRLRVKLRRFSFY